MDLYLAVCLSIIIILHTLDKMASYGHVPPSVVSPNISVLLVVDMLTGTGFLKGDIRRSCFVDYGWAKC
jgi:hypothetical protein